MNGSGRRGRRHLRQREVQNLRRWLREWNRVLEQQRQQALQRKRECTGCRHWRPLREGRGVYACHYCVDTGRTRLRLDENGAVVLPGTPCPHYLREEDYTRRHYHRSRDLFFDPAAGGRKEEP